MSLRFYIGGSGAGKSRNVFAHIIKASMEEPRTRFLVLVPEQSTMETQRQIVRLHPRHGILNIDVLSMTRLAYRVFSEVGYRREMMLEEIGKTFLLEKIALEQKNRLPSFGYLLTKPEFLARMKAMISELMIYGVSPEELESLSLNPDSPLAFKMQDIILLYREFRKRLEGSYMTTEEVPEKLSLLAEDSKMFRDAVVVMDGFTGFTPLQLLFIRRILPLVRELHVTVTMDPDINPFGRFQKSSLFLMSHEMVRDLSELAREVKVPMEPPVYIRSGPESRHGASPQLMELERRLFRRSHREDSRVQHPAPGIRLVSASDPRTEIAFVAREICRMVREEGLRYRDFAIVTGDLESYGMYVRETFSEAEIPFFIDEKRSLLKNPFIEYLRAALEAVTDQYSYSSMFRMLKSGASPFDRNMTDHLENYVLARGIRGKKKWREPFIRHYRGEDPGEVPVLNGFREEICALMDPLADVMAGRGSTVREKTEALRAFCAGSHAEELLSEREESFLRAGRPDLAREYAQVWPYVDSFLDKLVAVLGDERISMADYRALIEAGFGEARIAIIPPGNDRVTVADMERSRLADVRVLFFVGVNEGLIPKAPSDGGVLSEADRAELLARDVKLKPSSRTQMYIDRFYLYLTLTKPSDRLFLSWSGANVSGEILRPAYLIGVLRRLFPGLAVENANREQGTSAAGESVLMDLLQGKNAEPGDPVHGKKNGLADLVQREKTGISLLVEGLARIDEMRPSGAYFELFSYYSSHPLYAGRCRKLLAAARAEKHADRIGQAAARALYGTVLTNSASRLELFSACRFAHFLSYGLKLKERREYAFSGMDMGSLLHRSLELFEEETGRRGISWAALAEDDGLRNAIAAGCMARAVDEYGSTVFTDSARDRYQLNRLQRLMAATAWSQARQLSAGDFVPAGAEAGFRNMEELDASVLELPHGARMLLTGRIDRVDVCETGGAAYVKIMDYKTGNVTFDLTEVYYGLQLQLAVYLDAAMDMLRRAGRCPVPAGMFYCHIGDPVVDYREMETDDETARRILTELRLSGPALQDMDVLKHLDHELRPEKSSEVIPVSLKKDGNISARSLVLCEEDFLKVCAHVKRTIRKSAELILAGHAEIDPYEYRNETACDYCPFRGVCGFDRRIPGYQYRSLPSMKREEILARMDSQTTQEN